MGYNQLNSKQIRAGVITDSHIAVGAAISESKLNIDWSARAAEILATRTVVDFVQVNGVAVAGSSASVVVTANITPPPATADNEKGAIVQSGKNKVVIRNASTGEPLIGSAGKEVYGRLTHDGTDYTLTFYTKDGTGNEVAHTVAEAVTIDFQYPQRFDLSTVSETFAANEKFVDGAADVSERLDLQQIVKDVFGGAYTLDHDGQANRAKTLAQELVDETSGVTNTSVRAKDIIDEVVSARGASASLPAELARIEGLTSQSNSEVVDARKSTALTGIEVTHASLDARLEATETVVKSTKDEVEAARGASASLSAELARIEGVANAVQSDVNAVETEIANARNGKADLASELAAIRQSVTDESTARANADTAIDGRIDALEAKNHQHFAEDKRVQAGDPLIGTSSYTLQSAEKFVAGNKSLQVYLNGMLQMVDVHYTEVEAGGAGTGGTGINFAPELIAEGDIIQLRWTK